MYDLRNEHGETISSHEHLDPACQEKQAHPEYKIIEWTVPGNDIREVPSEECAAHLAKIKDALRRIH